MRLIDADALVDKISSETIFIKDGLWVSKIIADAPTVADIVWCKDCEHSYIAQVDSYGKMQRYCNRKSSWSEPTEDNDFCSWAKMKGGAE